MKKTIFILIHLFNALSYSNIRDSCKTVNLKTGSNPTNTESKPRIKLRAANRRSRRVAGGDFAEKGERPELVSIEVAGGYSGGHFLFFYFRFNFRFRW